MQVIEIDSVPSVSLESLGGDRHSLTINGEYQFIVKSNHLKIVLSSMFKSSLCLVTKDQAKVIDDFEREVRRQEMEISKLEDEIECLEEDVSEREDLTELLEHIVAKHTESRVFSVYKSYTELKKKVNAPGVYFGSLRELLSVVSNFKKGKLSLEDFEKEITRIDSGVRKIDYKKNT